MKLDRLLIASFMGIFMTIGLILTVSTAERRKEPTISGIIRDSSGHPATNVTVSMFPAGPEVTNDNTGHYEIPFPAHMLTRKPGVFLIARDLKKNEAVIAEMSQTSSNVDINLKPALVAGGRVTDTNGNPIPNAIAMLGMFIKRHGGTDISRVPVLVDSNGAFEVPAIPADLSNGRSYHVACDAPGFGIAIESVEWDDSAERRVELKPLVLKRADQKISGTVFSSEGKPLKDVTVSLTGVGQHFMHTNTDAQGRFSFAGVCAGSVQLSAPVGDVYGQIQAEAGWTNANIRVDQAMRNPEGNAPAMIGKPLPNLSALGFEKGAFPRGKPILLCLADIQQRPSRHMLAQLAERYSAIESKGIVVLAFQSSPIADTALHEYKSANQKPFPIGSSETIPAWVSDKATLPFLILTDSRGKVTAEGFGLNELDSKLAHGK